MPITKSAKKAVRHAALRTEQRKPYKTGLKNVYKDVLALAKTDKAAAAKELPKAYKAIDIAAKKHLIHKNNAARKKSRLCKACCSK
jgi:small subunit ribosomal protein S20